MESKEFQGLGKKEILGIGDKAFVREMLSPDANEILKMGILLFIAFIGLYLYFHSHSVSWHDQNVAFAKKMYGGCLNGSINLTLHRCDVVMQGVASGEIRTEDDIVPYFYKNIFHNDPFLIDNVLLSIGIAAIVIGIIGYMGKKSNPFFFTKVSDRIILEYEGDELISIKIAGASASNRGVMSSLISQPAMHATRAKDGETCIALAKNMGEEMGSRPERVFMSKRQTDEFSSFMIRFRNLSGFMGEEGLEDTFISFKARR